MVRIPYIKIPSVRVGSIVPTSNIGAGATPAPPTPITYLTQWKMLGNSEVHTLPYPDGIVLPTGYKRCEYLEFHGTEYINSGVYLKNDIGLSLDLSTTVMSKTTIGARNTLLKGVLFGYHYTSSGNYRMYLAYGSDSSGYIIQTNVCDGHLHHIVLDSQQAKIDNENVAIDRGSEFPRQSLYIGTWNSDGAADNRMFVGKMYSVRLYDSNGNLFNGIPCLDDNNVPCLYDTVSNTAFYNDGTGTFGYKLYPQPTEIWSCGEYSEVDNKWHIRILPEGYGIVDIALDEPLRKVNDVADSIEFPSDIEGKALVTRPLGSRTLTANVFSMANSKRFIICNLSNCKQELSAVVTNTLVAGLTTYSYDYLYVNYAQEGIYGVCKNAANLLCVTDPSFIVDGAMTQAFRDFIEGKEVIYELATPTTELVDAPQIEEAESYSCVISQGGKAVEWSSFITNSE